MNGQTWLLSNINIMFNVCVDTFCFCIFMTYYICWQPGEHVFIGIQLVLYFARYLYRLLGAKMCHCDGGVRFFIYHVKTIFFNFFCFHQAGISLTSNFITNFLCFRSIFENNLKKSSPSSISVTMTRFGIFEIIHLKIHCSDQDITYNCLHIKIWK